MFEPIVTGASGTPQPGRSSWIPSSKRNPCPICGRTKDGDCRISIDGKLVLCHHPKADKPSQTTTGLDGQVWAFTRNSDDGRCGVYTPHKERRLTVVASGGTAINDGTSKPIDHAPVSPVAVLASEHQGPLTLASFLPAMEEKASRREGEFFYFDAINRTQRKEETGKKKSIYAHSWKASEQKWTTTFNKNCPSWNEALIREAEGLPVYFEGEKCADIATRDFGLIGLSLPGQSATKIEECEKALKRHKDFGLEAVVYVADNDKEGKKKKALMAQAASNAVLPFIGLDAEAIWDDMPEGGSIDDVCPIANSPEDVKRQLEAAMKAAVQANSVEAEAKSESIVIHDVELIEVSQDNHLDKETDEKESALLRLVDQIVEARAKGDTVRDAALMSQTWRLGIPSATTDSLVLQKWAEKRGISTEKAEAPVEGRTIGSTGSSNGLRQRLPGFLLENGLHLLIADAGTGKTTMSLEMARLLANGSQKGFLDQQEGVSQGGKVLFIGTDGGSTAFQTLSDYATDLADANEWGGVEFWCEEASKRKPWVLSLPNLELLVQRLSRGDIRAVFIDTINAVFQGAGISPYLGPVDQYLRLLKAIACPYGPLVMLGHTNRGGSGIKGIGGSPAFQEVPDVLHRIERQKQPQEDGTLVFTWTVEKLRGESYRQFSYAKSDIPGETFKIVEGHFFTNCGDKLLLAIKSNREQSLRTAPKDLCGATKEAASSVRAALSRLRQKGLIEKRGVSFVLTAAGEAHLKTLRRP